MRFESVLLASLAVGSLDAFAPVNIVKKPTNRPSVAFFAENGGGGKSYLEDMSSSDGKASNDNGDDTPKPEYLEEMAKIADDKEEESYTPKVYDREEAQVESRNDDGEEAEGVTLPYLEDMPKTEVEETAEEYSTKLYDRATASKSEKDDEEEEKAKSPYLQDLARFGDELEQEGSGSSDAVPVDGPPPGDQDALTKLLQIGASTGRGEFASNLQKDTAEDMIRQLEAQNPTPEPAKSPLMNGRWELLYSSTQLFRSSPFFMAGRAVCETPEQAKQYDWFCDMHRAALAISSIGQVRQIVSPTRLVSEFEVKVGSIPFLSDFTPFAYSGGLPVTIEGAIVSSADITPTYDGNSWEIFMDTVEIKGSNIPGLRQALDQGLKLGSRDLGSFLESNIDSYTNPRPLFETTYLSDTIRISRDQDGKVFVYGKVSGDTLPTDYSAVDSDLGIGKLLEGFNDAITKFYL